MSFHITTVGFNHNTMPISLREKLSFDGDTFGPVMRTLARDRDILEYFLLSTCNRVELTFVTKNPTSEDDAFSLFSSALTGCSDAAGRLPSPLHRNEIYIHMHLDAIVHMFAVCCGLDSLALGETQITSQFKTAMFQTNEFSWLGVVLNKLTQEALSTAKKVRTSTNICKNPTSISHMAVRLAQHKSGDLSQKSIVLVGAGEMGSLAAQYLIKYSPQRIVIANRTPENAKILASKIGVADTILLSELESSLLSTDIVLCATRSSDYILKKEDLIKLQMQRNNKPLTIIDISLPRNIDPQIQGLPGVQLYDIDDIKQIVATQLTCRKVAAQAGERIIIENANMVLKWLETINTNHTIGDFKVYLDTLFETELQKTMNKSNLRNLNAEFTTEIQNMLTSISRKLMGDAATTVNNPPSGYHKEQLAYALKTLFPRRPL